MKKILALILAMGLALSFGACGEETADGTETAKEETVEATATAETSGETEKTEVAEQTETAEPSENAEKPEEKDSKPEKDEKASAEKKDRKDPEKKDEGTPEKEEPAEEKPEENTLGVTENLTLGENNGSMYVNAYTGIGFNLPEGWSFFSDEKMNEINQFKSKPEGEALKKAFERPNGVYLMAAQGPNGSVNMMISKLPDEAKDIDETQFLNASLSKTRSEFEKQGATDIEISNGICNMSGKKLPAAKIGYTASGKRVNQTVFCAKKDGYMTIAVMIAVDEPTDKIEAGFFGIN